jgi:hypothetical protein
LFEKQGRIRVVCNRFSNELQQRQIAIIFQTFLVLFKAANINAPTTAPTAIETKYIKAFPTIPITNIPPCGAINVQPNNIDKPPAIAEPIIQDGNTRSGSLEANGIAPSDINESPNT